MPRWQNLKKEMNKIFSASWFFDLESQLREMGLDSDDKSFAMMKFHCPQVAVKSAQ